MKRIYAILIIILLLVGMLILVNIPHEEEVIIPTFGEDYDATKTFITLPNRLKTVAWSLYNKNGGLLNRSRFYFEGTNFKSNVTGLVSTNSKLVIDISSYQGDIDFEKVKDEVDGVIIRIGYGSKNLDSKLERNLTCLKKYNIPYGIYLYSYAENKHEAYLEAKFTLDLIKKYDIKPTLGVYYDIEDKYINGNKIFINKEKYEKIITTYINYLDEYNPRVYTNAKLYNYAFNDKTKKYVTWIAQYNYYFEYQESYKMWQYTASGTISGIETLVDMNVLFN